MRRCPKCNQTFTDDNSFCLMDGTNLVVADTAENNNYSSDAPTVFLSNAPTPDSINTQQKPTPNWLYPLLGLFIGLTSIFGSIAFYSASVDDNSKTENNQTEQANKSENTLNAEQTTELSESSVRNLLNNWESSQDSQNFRIYQTCYSTDFEGVKRKKDGSKQTMNLTGWLNDRRLMLKNVKGLDVEMKNLKITKSGDFTVAEFDQYYRSRSYSDWGAKVIKVKMSENNAPKIFYEELLNSNPLN